MVSAKLVLFGPVGALGSASEDRKDAEFDMVEGNNGFIGRGVVG